MSYRYQFQAMRQSTDDFPVGSPEWCEGMTVRTQMYFDKAKDFGVSPLVEVIRTAFPYEPWMHAPIKRPDKRADIYFSRTIGKDWHVLIAMLETEDPTLAKEVSSRCNGGKTGRPPKESHDNIITFEANEQGTSRAYNLNRLSRQAPELYERVLDGELSANAAAIEAGFRPPSLTINAKDPVKTAASIRRKFGDDFCQLLKEAL